MPISKKKLRPLPRRPSAMMKRPRTPFWKTRSLKYADIADRDKVVDHIAKLNLKCPASQHIPIQGLAQEHFSEWAGVFMTEALKDTDLALTNFKTLAEERPWRYSSRAFDRKDFVHNQHIAHFQRITESFTKCMEEHASWVESELERLKTLPFAEAHQRHWTPSAQGPFPFLKLPLEVRNMIYKLLLSPPSGRIIVRDRVVDTISNTLDPVAVKVMKPHLVFGTVDPDPIRNGFQVLPLRNTLGEPLQTSLLRTCRRINVEASDILYKQPLEVRQVTGHLTAIGSYAILVL